MADVTIPVSSMFTFIAVCKSAIMALPANQSEVPANYENTITGNILFGTLVRFKKIKIAEVKFEYIKIPHLY